MRLHCILMLLSLFGVAAFAGCGGDSGRGFGNASLVDVDLSGIVLDNSLISKSTLGKNGDTGFAGETLSGDPVGDAVLVLLRNGTDELDRGAVADGNYALSFRPSDMDAGDYLVVELRADDDTVLASLRLSPVDFHGLDNLTLNLEWRPNVADPANPGQDSLVAFLALPDGLDLAFDNAVDSDGDGTADRAGARAWFADNFIAWDADLDGFFGEPSDIVLFGVPPALFDDSAADGYDNDPDARELSAPGVQHTLGAVAAAFDLPKIVSQPDNPVSALLALQAARAGADSLFGAALELQADTGEFDNGQSMLTITLDPADAHVRFTARGRAVLYLELTVPPASGGAANVVVNPDNGNDPGAATLIIQAPSGAVPPPEFLGIEPATGPAAGGTNVVITGLNFERVHAVRFGGAPAAFTIVNATIIEAVTPEGASGAADVTLLDTRGQLETAAGAYLYIPAPAVTVVTPDTGSAAGGTDIVITGGHFQNGAQAHFGAAAATNVNVINATTLTCDAPAGTADARVAVTVTNPDGQSGLLDDAYAYTAPVPGVIVITEPGGTQVTEGGAGDTYAVALGVVPTDDVIVTIDPDGQLDLGGGAGVAVQLIFTSGDWDETQTVTVAAVDDALIEGNHTGAITHAAASADPAYAGLAGAAVTAGITDNDSAGVSIVQSGGSTNVAEGGMGDSYTLVLTAQSTAPVTVTVDPDGQLDLGGGAGASVDIVFAADAWDTPQTVTVNAVNDAIAEGVHSGAIAHTVASADEEYDGLAVGGVLASIADNEVAGVTITESGGDTEVTENGATDTYTVVLTSQPLDDVTVTLTPAAELDLGAGFGVAVDLTFTDMDWDDAQTVTVEALNDDVETGDRTADIAHASASNDGDYDIDPLTAITVTIHEDDNAGVTIVESGGATAATEGGAGDGYTIVLTSEPTDDVTVTVTPPAAIDLGDGAGVAVDLLFTAADWDDSQAVTLVVADNDVFTGDYTLTITHAADSVDTNYDALAIPAVDVDVTEDDVVGITVTQSGGTTAVTEGCDSDSYTIVLTSEPTDDVIITIDPDDQADLGAGAGTAIDLTFTSGDWDTPQTVTVASDYDGAVEGDHAAVITHAVASADGNYDGFVIADVTAAITDNTFDATPVGADVRLDTDNPGAGKTYANKSGLACAGDRVYSAWEDDRNGFLFRIYVNASKDRGQSWLGEVRVDHNGSGTNSLAPRLAAAGDNACVVWYDGRDGRCDIWFNRSTDGGVTWDGSDTRLDTDGAGAGSSMRPQIVAEGDTVVVAWQDGRDGKHDIYANCSTDGGATWLANDVRLDTDAGGSAQSEDVDLAIVGNRVYAVWMDARDGDRHVYFNYSEDYGETWQGADQRLNDKDSMCWRPRLAAAGNNVYVVWHDNRDGAFDIYAAVSQDGGQSWMDDARLDTDAAGTSGSFNPEIACGGVHVYVTWHDSRNGARDIYFNRSADGGTTWGGADIRLDTDGAGDDFSYRPQIACAGCNVYVTWWEKRNGGNAYLNFSRNHGEDWQAADILVDQDGTNVSRNPRLCADGDTVWIGWEDFRNGIFDLYVQVVE